MPLTRCTKGKPCMQTIVTHIQQSLQAYDRIIDMKDEHLRDLLTCTSYPSYGGVTEICADPCNRHRTQSVDKITHSPQFPGIDTPRVSPPIPHLVC